MPEQANNKTADIHFRVTKKQKEKIAALAKQNGMSMSEYILYNAIGKRVVGNQIEVKKILEEIAIRDNKVDNNINQIARILNKNYKNLNDDRINELYFLMDKYIHSQEELTIKMRSLYRLLANNDT